LNLRFRLAVSYLAVIGLFLVAVGLSWFLLGGTEVLEQLHHEAISLAERLATTAERTAATSGWPAARQLLAATPVLEGTSIVLFQPEPHPLQGSLQPHDEAALREAWKGRSQERMENALSPARRRVELWLPVGREPVQAVLWLSVPAAASPKVRERAAASLTKAALLAVSLSFAAGLVLSSSIARPVSRLAEATEALGQADLSTRVPVTGRGELAELAVRFNRMAERLEESQLRLREQKERAEHLERTRREFLADVSHNLKTPLAAIQGWTEALQDGLVPGQEPETLARIHRQVGFVARTVQRLLDLSRWDSGEVALNLEEFDPAEPLMEAVEALGQAAVDRGIELELQGVQPGLRVRADRGRLRELMQICLENAVHHAGEGARVQVVFEPVGSRLRVTIADTGAGIAPERLRELTSRSRQGLGVAIAHKLAAAHGGEFELTSRPGEGTRATFSVGVPAPADTGRPESPP